MKRSSYYLTAMYISICISVTTEPCASISELKTDKDHLLLKHSLQLGGLRTMQQLQHGSQRDSPESN